MKKLAIFATLLTLVLSGCAENTLDNIAPEVNNEITLPDLTAGFADDDVTKTYVEESKYLRWHEADLITAFYGNTLNRQYKFKGKTGDNSGTFSLVPSGELGTGNALEAIYAIYPYAEGATITDKGEISLSLPATQYYAENSFGRGANTMIAITENVEDTFLGFKNACGYLKLKLYNESGARLKSVEVRGNNSEKIAGSATATIEFGGVPTVVMGNDATTTVTLDCGEDGIALGTTAETATELWVVLPEVTFEGGITITATDTEGKEFEKTTTKPVAITRNEIQPMKALGCEFAIPDTWKIYYTASSKVEPYNKTVFGANYVSNEWNKVTGKGVITFDGEVTHFGDYAFYRRSSLASVTIPDGVTSIGYQAFYYCSNLASITIPDSVTSIGEQAFYNCSSLESVTIGNGVTSIGGWAFQNCSSLTSITIPDSVTSIGNHAFSHCSRLAEFRGKFASSDGRCLIIDGVLDSFAHAGLTEYTIPDSVTEIGKAAFGSCDLLKSITIPDGVTSIGVGAFQNCTSLTSITIPDSVTSIGDSAFDSCFSLASITIPDSVTSIGEEAFRDCDSLTSVTIPDSVTSIGETVFCSCSSLTSITIPDSVTSIGDYAFSNCSSLTSIAIPDSVTYIGYYAFAYCSSLTSITIPESVLEIGDYAFAYCSSLTSVYCKPTTPPSAEYYYIFNKNASGRKIYVPEESVEAYKTAQYWSSYADAIEPYVFE